MNLKQQIDRLYDACDGNERPWEKAVLIDMQYALLEGEAKTKKELADFFASLEESNRYAYSESWDSIIEKLEKD